MSTPDRLWNRNYCKVMYANFALFFAFYILTPLLPLYLSTQFAATKDVIGIVLSGYSITALLMRPFSGYVVDTFPRKTVLMVCFTAFAIFFAGYLAASTLLLFTLVRTLHGGPFGALTVANATVAIDVLPSSRRTEGIGYYGLSNNLAMAIAPTIGIFIYTHTHNFELLFWIALAVAVSGLLSDATVTSSKLPKAPSRLQKKQESPTAGTHMETTQTEGTRTETAGTRWERLKVTVSLDRFFLIKGWLLGVNMVAFGFCFGVLSNYLAIYSKEHLGITGGTGTYFMLCAIGLILSRLQGGRALRHGLLTHNAAGGMVISLVGYTLFIAVPTLAPHIVPLTTLSYYGSALLIGLGNGHMWPAFQNMIIGVAHNNQRGTANSTILVSWDIGMGLGILIGGITAEHLGYGAAFWSVVAVNAAGVITFFAATRRFFLLRRLSTDIR